jgi:hypothetical protein
MLKVSVLKLLNTGVRSEVLTLVTSEDLCLPAYDAAKSRRMCCHHHPKGSLP